MDDHADVIVVGTGNAGFCAAHAAAERGARVLMLEKGPEGTIGGNTYFTAGAIRTTYQDIDDLADIIDDPDERLPYTDIDPYGPADFAADMRRLTLGRCDPALTDAMVHGVADTVRWMRGHGVRFRLQYERQAYERENRFRFWGGLPLATVDGGKGLVAQHLAAAERAGVRVRCDTAVDRVLRDPDGRVVGVAAGTAEFRAGAVVLAAGGFQASKMLRAQYLGPNWDLAKVRGTPHNTGGVLTAALRAGAQSAGHWSGCHAVAWDANAPRVRRPRAHQPLDQAVLSAQHRGQHGGPALPRRGGRDPQLHLRQVRRGDPAPAGRRSRSRSSTRRRLPSCARPSTKRAGVSRFQADTIAELAEQAGIDAAGLTPRSRSTTRPPASARSTRPSRTGSARPDSPRRRATGPSRLDQPPYLAFAVTCGITFTFGGVKIDA